MHQNIRRDIVIGSRRFSNFFWVIILLFGGCCFLMGGFSSYFKLNILPFSDLAHLNFIPQGIIMSFYGSISCCFGIYILLTFIYDIGSGYNEYNKNENLVKIVRKGFPGKNRKILLTYSLSNIRSIGIKIVEGLNPTRNIYLCLKDNRKIPLISLQEIESISKIEQNATLLANFLELKLENL